MKLNNFTIRLISGAVYVALIITALLIPNGMLAMVMLMFFGVMAVIEFNRMTRIAYTRLPRIITDCIAVCWFVYMGFLLRNNPIDTSVWVPTIAYVLYLFARGVFSEEKGEKSTLYNSLFTMLYIGFPLFMGAYFSFETTLGLTQSVMNSPFNGTMLLAVFIIVWISDTGAYLSGMTFGRHKLYPRLSPNKTIEGMLGGFITATLGGMALVFIFPNTFGQTSIWLMALYGLAVSIAAMLGDLFESRLKRQAGVKDSGKLIPGHGGILDRLDSFFFAMPIAAIFYFLF